MHLVTGAAVTTSSVVTYQNAKQVMFIFSVRVNRNMQHLVPCVDIVARVQDLAIKDEGQFFLRYRIFNTLFQVAGPTPIPVLAECIGGSFRVYSTKNFPGLRASTELTKVCLTPFSISFRDSARSGPLPLCVPMYGASTDSIQTE